MEAQLIKQEDGAVLKESACDTSDYLISVACGAIAGLVDIFFVGMPGESTLGTRFAGGHSGKKICQPQRMESKAGESRQRCQCDWMVRKELQGQL